jgi:ketosteroid isomerase-like protein
MNRRFFVTAAIITLCHANLTAAEPSADKAAAATEAVKAFHRALKEGNADAAMQLLAPDALILESGHTQTREQYGAGHLQGDMALMRSASVTHSDFTVKQEGGVAWTTQTYRVTGTHKGREIDSQGVELMVLTEMPAGWRIRAVHWSNYAIKPKASPSPAASVAKP